MLQSLRVHDLLWPLARLSGMKTKRKLETDFGMKISKHKISLALERHVRPLSVSERTIDSKIAMRINERSASTGNQNQYYCSMVELKILQQRAPSNDAKTQICQRLISFLRDTEIIKAPENTRKVLRKHQKTSENSRKRQKTSEMSTSENGRKQQQKTAICSY